MKTFLGWGKKSVCLTYSVSLLYRSVSPALSRQLCSIAPSAHRTSRVQMPQMQGMWTPKNIFTAMLLLLRCFVSSQDHLFPPANMASPVAEKLRKVLRSFNWAREGLGLQNTFPDDTSELNPSSSGLLYFSLSLIFC